jgi:hypothetical protein
MRAGVANIASSANSNNPAATVLRSAKLKDSQGAGARSLIGIMHVIFVKLIMACSGAAGRGGPGAGAGGS